MQLPLKPELQAIIEEAVRSGRYATPLDAAREAFALLEEHEAKFQALRREIEIGRASPVAADVGEAVAMGVEARGRARLAELRKAK